MLAKSSLASNCTKWVLFYNRFSEVIFLFSIPKSKQKHSHRGTKSWEIWDHSGTGGCPWRSWCNWREGSRDLCHFCDLDWSHQGLFWLTWIWSTHCEKIHERESTEREREREYQSHGNRGSFPEASFVDSGKATTMSPVRLRWRRRRRFE